VIPEDEAPREGPRREAQQRDVLAARRARRAGIADPVPLRRAEAAEATVRTLEASLADLRRRLLEAEHERERAGQQLVEREHELRRVKQREYAEQQLRVEAEEHFTRLRRGHHAELDRLRQRVSEARAAAQHAQELRVRAEEERAELAAHVDRVSESCARLESSVLALHGAASELRTTFERERSAAQARIRELEQELAQVHAQRSAAEPDAEHREEMVGALAAAVERLRARVAVGELPEIAPRTPFAPPAGGAEVEAAGISEPAAVSTPQQPAAAPRSEAVPPPSDEPAAPTPSIEVPQQVETELETAASNDSSEGVRGSSEGPIPTVFVVPRLFPAPRRSRPRLASLGRRLGTRLLDWAERSQRG
jgi:hypothetical protein